jgi:6-phosphofructokinase
VVVLGHLLRGGSPTSFDRLAAMRFGTAAVRALDEGQSGIMVALGFPNVNYVALEEVAGRMKGVPAGQRYPPDRPGHGDQLRRLIPAACSPGRLQASG